MSKRALASLALAGALIVGFSPSALACAPIFMPPDPTVSGTAEQANAFEVLVAKQGEQVTQVYRMGVTVAGRGFAWVVPVPAVPDFLLVDEGELQQIDEALRPRFELRREVVGSCGGGAEREAAAKAPAADMALGAPTASAGAVQVLKRQSIGPFDAVVLAAESQGDLTAWLTSNGFAVPSRLGPSLSPYLNSGAKIVAVKVKPEQLRQGYVPPLGLSFKAKGLSLPLRLAALGASQRSKVIVTVLGDRRAVPTTYRHGELNEAYINFENGGANYDEVVSLAMAGAGGRAFVTDGAMPMRQGIVQANQPNWGLLPGSTGDDIEYTAQGGAEAPATIQAMPAPPVWVEKVRAARALACDPFGSVALLAALAPAELPAGTGQMGIGRVKDLEASSSCAPDPGSVFLNFTVAGWLQQILDEEGPAEFKDAQGRFLLQELSPRATAFRQAGKRLPERLYDRVEAHLSAGATGQGGGQGDTTAFSQLLRGMKFATRLYTLMPPSAMTEDPGFVMAANLPEVQPLHRATLEVLCGPQFTEANAPRAIRLANGEAYLVAEGVPTPWEEKPLPRPMPRCGTVSVFNEQGLQQSLIEDNAELIRQVGQALRQVKVQVLGFTVGFGPDGKLALLGGPGIAGLGAGLAGGGPVQGTAANPTGRTYVGSGCACAAPSMRPPSLAEGSEEAGSWALLGTGMGAWWWRGRRRRPRA